MSSENRIRAGAAHARQVSSDLREKAARVVSDSAAIRARSEALLILLVEDHHDSAEALRRLLVLEGHDVVVAENVHDAERACHNSHFTNLLCDLGLPDGSGLDLVRTVKRLCPGIRTVALTGYGMPADIEAAARAGFDAHLLKPVTQQQVLTVLQ